MDPFNAGTENRIKALVQIINLFNTMPSRDLQSLIFPLLRVKLSVTLIR